MRWHTARLSYRTQRGGPLVEIDGPDNRADRSGTGFARLGPTGWFALLFAVFVVFQIAVFFGTTAFLPNGFETENYYSPIASNLKNYGVLSGGVYPNLPLETDRMPLFPTVLAGLYTVFGEFEVVGVVFNNVLIALGIVFVHFAGRMISPAVAIFAPAILMFDTVYVMEANRNHTDSMFFLFMSIFIFLAVRLVLRKPNIPLIAAASAVLLLAAFTRPVPIYLWAPISAAFLIVFWRTSTLKRAAALVLVFVVIHAVGMGAWMARNHAITGAANFATMKSDHLTYFFAPYVLELGEGIPSEQTFEDLSVAVAARVAAEGLDRTEESAYASQLGWDIVRGHPIAAVGVILRNQPRLFLGYPFEPLTALLGPEKLRAYFNFNESYASSRFLFDTGLERRIGLIKFHFESGLIIPLAYGFVNKAITGLAALLGGVGILVMLFTRQQRLWPLGVLSIAYLAYMVPISSLVTAARFRLPIMPLLAIGTVFLLHYLIVAWRARRARTRERNPAL